MAGNEAKARSQSVLLEGTPHCYAIVSTLLRILMHGYDSLERKEKKLTFNHSTHQNSTPLNV